MPIENRNLTPGTRLVATYKRQHYACMVSAGEDGRLIFTLDDGRTFTSPSAAGSAIMGGSACNGWKFWSVEGADPTPAEKPAATSKPASAKTRASKKKPSSEHRAINPASSQEGAADGMTRFFCDCCMKSFEVPTEQGAPMTCPEGHAALIQDTTVAAGA